MIFLDKIKGSTGIKPANLFFIELIIVLLFFSFSVAVILQIFAAADHRQDMSDITEGAVICSQSVAEVFSVKGSLAETADIVFGGIQISGNAAGITLDDSFAPSENGRITLHLQQRDEEKTAGVLSYLDMSFVLDGKEVYFLSCASYKSYGGDGDE